MTMLHFSQPWLLGALILLPVIWFLLRLTPPLPKQVRFPPLALLAGLKDAEETPAGTPWWVLLLRLLLAAAVIIALAGPHIGTPVPLKGRGPLVLLIDNGWSAASNWSARQKDALDAARQAGTRPVAVLATAGHPDPSLMDKGAAMRKIEALQPRPWLVSRQKALTALKKLDLTGAEVIWLSDDIEDGLSAQLAKALHKARAVRLLTDPPGHKPLALVELSSVAGGFEATIIRAGTEGVHSGLLIAYGRQGQRLASARFTLAAGKNRTEVRLKMPLQMRNKTGRVEIAAAASAGAVRLMDRGAPRRSVGIVMAEGADEPLLSGAYYLKRALSPYADILSGSVSDLVTRHASVLILPGGRLIGKRHDQVKRFVEKGGLLIRFADAREAEGGDDLTPVRLRSGGRFLGGAMAWAAPQHIARFPDTGPFGGLSVPTDVTVSRQILAEPSVDLAQHSWARLSDGTPMVTAAQRGQGWIVQFHVTAGPGWSNLPLSGLYVAMLRRLLPLSTGAAPAEMAGARVLPPYRLLDGFGHLKAASDATESLRAGEIATLEASARHPAGLYGAPDHARALNAAGPRTALLLLPEARRLGLSGHFYGEKTRLDLSGPVLIAAVGLLLLDFLVSLSMRGLIRFTPRRLVPVLVAGLVATLLMPAGHAAPAKDEKAALDTRLAYVETGVAATDAMSRAGLSGLGQALAMRTSYEPESPIGVDLEKDDLSFYPLLYWPMDPGQKDLSPEALTKLADYMRLGGTLLIDTRDLTLGSQRGPENPGQKTLRRLLSGLDLPPLGPVPARHALSRAFYLLSSFPGRWEGGKLWVEPPGSDGGGDQVSSLIIGGNDWAAAWAVDAKGRYLADVSPGGARQREMAYRFGINVVMYALTGNYKTDQIHVKALLKRLDK